MRNLMSAAVLGLLAALAVVAAEPGHTRYRPHQVLPKPPVHAMLASLDRGIDQIAANAS